MPVLTMPAAVVLRSHCVRSRNGVVVAGALALGFSVMALLIGGLTLGDGETGPGWALLGVGAVLLVAAVPLFRRGQLPLDLTLTDSALELQPTGRAVGFGYQPETWPLASVTGYSRTEQNGSTYLKVYLADKRAVSFAEKMRGLSGNEPGTAFVPLAELVEALGQHLSHAEQPVREKPNFYQGFWGKLLAGVCALLLATGVVLLFVPGVEWTQGVRLIAFSSVYLGAYSANRRPKRG